ncbi:MAG: four helix bundle protein [Phycisphaerales bacterium]|nr:four helix bundle protein [Phycisphaerales bacterium]
MVFMFEKLDVYQKTVDFADRTIGLTGEFPRGYGFLADQADARSI